MRPRPVTAAEGARRAGDLTATQADALDALATVYGEAANGLHTVVLRTGLACRLVPIRFSGMEAYQRAEEGHSEWLFYDVTYTLVDTSQLEIAGERWNPIANTNLTYAVYGQIVARRVTVTRTA